MTGIVIQAIREAAEYRLTIAFGIPAVGVALAIASSILTPRGKAKGLITGAYMLMAALGASCLLFAFIGLFAGEPRGTVLPLFMPGVVLTVIMGIFSPEVIRQYQQFEFRKRPPESSAAARHSAADALRNVAHSTGVAGHDAR
jgi:MFS family permease